MFKVILFAGGSFVGFVLGIALNIMPYWLQASMRVGWLSL
jgi:hypothetical protein